MPHMTEPRESSDASIREFLTAVSSADAMHGAVSAAALSGALGTSMLQMVAAIPQTRSDSDSDRAKLAAASTALGGLQEELLEAIETETTIKDLHCPQHAASQRRTTN
jgi:formiminotetrahydrofolate cyclodeaminase